MSFTKVAPAGIGTEPGTSIRLGDSLLHSTGLDIGTGTGIGVTIRQHGDATFTGIITATKFVGDMEPGGGTGTFDSLTVTGNLGVGGTVTYEDVSNVDSVGIITARGGIRIGAGHTLGPISGIVTYFGDGSQLTGIEGGVTSDAQENTIGGTNAGDSFNGTNATKNTLFGFDAGTAITDGDKNAFFGHKAGEKTTTGFWNVFVGEQAGRDNLGAYGNIAIGRMALLQNTGSNYSVAVGNGALVNCSGEGNIGIGFDAGQNIGGTQRNTVVGAQAGDSGNTLGGNCTLLGARAEVSVSHVANEITLGDANITHLRVPGIGVSFNNTGGTQLGIITATELDISGDIDVDGHTNLDNVSVAGVTTFSNTVHVGTGVTIETNGQATFSGITTSRGFFLPISTGSNTDNIFKAGVLKIFDNGSHLHIQAPYNKTLYDHSGTRIILTNDFRIQNTASSRTYFRGINLGAASLYWACLLYTSPSPRDRTRSRMPSSA